MLHHVLAALPAPLVLCAVAAILIAESGLLIGVVLPGATLVLSLGLLSSYGVVAPGAAIATVVVASAVGSHTAYARSRGGTGTVTQLVRRRIGAHRHDHILQLAYRYPLRTVAGGQLIGGVRTVVPRLAARADIGYRRFAQGNLPAAALWGGGLVLLGYSAGATYSLFENAVGLLGLPLIALVVLVWLLACWWRRVRAGTTSSTTSTAEAAWARAGRAPCGLASSPGRSTHVDGHLS